MEGGCIPQRRRCRRSSAAFVAAARMSAGGAPPTSPPSAAKARVKALQLGSSITLDPPVVLAPMAGVTDYPFRALCREFGASLCVSEMVLASALAAPLSNADTRLRASFGAGERPRSVQLYGVEPRSLAAATRALLSAAAEPPQHIDLNFGCPMPKVTARGGGAALCARPRLLASLVRAVVAEVRAAGLADALPVTAKFRLGLHGGLSTFLDAGDVCEAEGCAAVTLHARFAAQRYDGAARWEHIATLADRLSIPVLGNGDVRCGADAARMLALTRCAGVVVGRAALGEPWLFRDIADALKDPLAQGGVVEFSEWRAVMARHVRHAVEWALPWRDERATVRSLRRVLGWYLRGIDGIPAALLRELMQAESAARVEDALAAMDGATAPPPPTRVPRAVALGGAADDARRRVRLPPGWLHRRLEDATPPCAAAEGDASCG